MTTVLACGSCGAALRDGARFCDTCGSRLAASVDGAKYKQVTVLFADVVGSMNIAAAVDAERLRDIMTELVERSAAVVHRYGGTVEHTGDGVMALFGAPAALEDHAFRACLSGLAIQAEAAGLAADVLRRDGVELRVRVGLNSGRVIAGELGSGAFGYTATGEPVGFAQRMESAAPPGAVLLSESTARLVEHQVTLADSEWVHVKGVDQPVRARRLMAIAPHDEHSGRAEANLVGRRWEMAALDAIVDRAIGGRGSVVNVVGPPGIGKSRAAREAATLAAGRGVDVFWTFCESYTGDVPFFSVTRLLRAGSGIDDADDETARARLRTAVPNADPQDLLLLDDLLGVADPRIPLPQIDPDARRRRLTGLINTAWLARTEPALFVIEDAHWIDAISESMLADFLAVIAHTPSMVLITSRPEYQGALMRVHGAQTIALAPLGDSDTATLLSELLGADRSVAELATVIADRAAGNPFFAEEMIRELVQRGVLAGERGGYLCHADVADVAVPVTVQAAIEARIDRLNAPAKRTLNAASVIGARFEAELLAELGVDPLFDDLLSAELIDQVRFTPSPEYAFHHPLIRAVAYESQLKSDRAQWHRRLATAIQQREPGSVDDNAAMIAEHLESAGDLRAAYGWHMRAAAWAIERDVDAARVNWDRARRIADRLPDDDPEQLSMRIAPRTMLCATEYQGRDIHGTTGQFSQLRDLCAAAGDRVSLAIGMTGLLIELVYTGRIREGARVASEQMALLESIGEPNLTMPLSFMAFAAWFESGEVGELLRWSQTVIDLADGDSTKGSAFGVGSPLAVALTWRGYARWFLGLPEWRQDLDDAVAMVQRRSPSAQQHPATVAGVVTWTYGFAIQNGVLRADDAKVQLIEEAVRTAEAASNEAVLSLARYGLGMALLDREAPADRGRGLELLAQAREAWLRRQFAVQDVPVTELYAAREQARCGDRDAVIPVMRQIVVDLHQEARLGYGVWGTGVLVDTLLDRGAEADVVEAEEAIDRLLNLRADQDSAIREIVLLRLGALVARARGDDVTHRDMAHRYRAMAESLGYEGHIAWAKAMTEGER